MKNLFLKSWYSTINDARSTLNSQEIPDKIKTNKPRIRVDISKLREPNFSSFLFEALVGLLLGDGHLEVTSSSSNARFKMTYAARYFRFALYIFGLFCYYVTENCLYYSEVKSSPTSKLYGRFSFTTLYLPQFTVLHKLFYKPIEGEKNKYVKIVPLNIEELLTPVSLAFLVASDGNYNPAKKVIRICTDSFTKEEVDKISLVLLQKFDIGNRVERTSNNQFRIIIRTSQVTKFQNLIKDHLHPSFFYRINLPNGSI